jgi:hypothetical protein
MKIKKVGIKIHTKETQEKGRNKETQEKGKDQKETVGFLYFLRLVPFFSGTASCNSSLNFL